MRVAEISLPAIRHNVRHLRELTGGKVIAVIKANGYGHGATIAARAAIEGGAELLGVADLEEALSLRDAGVDAPLLCWLHGVGADFEAAVEHGIEIGVSHLTQLEALAAAARSVGRRATAQFKLDTGLSRNGAAPEEWDELFERGAELQREGVVLVRGVFSHLANAGDEADRRQAANFDDAVARLRAAGVEPEMIHLAASAATLTSPHLRYNTVRVGMAIYGLSPLADRTSADLGLVPAMTLRSEIVALRQVPEGTGVSYGFNHVVQSETTLGLVPIGYADGMPRALNGAGATVEVSGHHCPIVGRIGMDQCIVDLGRLGKKVSLGDPVVLFGDPSAGYPPVEVWAELMRTINYEIVASIGQRVVRVASEGEAGTAVYADAGVPASAEAGAEAEVEVEAEVESDPGDASVARVFEIDDPEAMHELGVRLGRVFEAGDLAILTGPLGAGKTTLSRGIGEGLGVRGPVTSPTFVLARTHPSLVGGAPLVHVDAYRLADASELDDLDLDFDGSVVIAEWGAGLVEERGSWIEIVLDRPFGAGTGSEPEGAASADDEDELVEPRTVTITGYGPRWRNGVL
jgi:alanine racemase